MHYDRINAELGRDQRVEHLQACREGTLDEAVYAPHKPQNAPRPLTGAYSIGMSVETESVVLPPLTAEEKKAIKERIGLPFYLDQRIADVVVYDPRIRESIHAAPAGLAFARAPH